MSKSSRDYWREREEEARKHTIADEEEYGKRLAEIYLKMQTNISREIDGFYGRYAAKNGITMDDARKRASKADMEALALKAKQYVAEKDFSDQANEEMALYNLTMKVNRLELLKAQMGLELLAGYSDAHHEIEKDILRTAMKEYERMAGVLGNSVKDAEKYAHALVNASFRHATFSDRLWNSENKLKNELERILRIGLIQGRNPNAMSPQIEKAFGVGQREAIRLVITEMCRVQTEVQKQSYERNGYEEYEFITEPDERLCDECRDLDGKIFKVRDMQPGHNAPPIHPCCRCSTAPHADRERLDELIRRIEEERGEDEDKNSELKFDYRNDKMSSRSRMPQDGGEGTIPAEYVRNYDDYETLSLSNDEVQTLKELRKLADESGNEYGAAFLEGHFTKPFSSGKNAFVMIPKDYLNAENVRLYHSHTNDTLLSAGDFKLLTRENVEMVAVATRNGDVYVATIGNGFRPTEEEFLQELMDIRTEADAAIMDNPNFWEWTPAQRTYMAIREQAYLIARRYGWRLEGGEL